MYRKCAGRSRQIRRYKTPVRSRIRGSLITGWLDRTVGTDEKEAMVVVVFVKGARAELLERVKGRYEDMGDRVEQDRENVVKDVENCCCSSRGRDGGGDVVISWLEECGGCGEL